ncbi:MAG: SpoIIE family protein phosphatase [Acidobacteriia bacterium]|nr:SpoIIE family protein phosphatase [Terriglobia bacterium]
MTLPVDLTPDTKYQLLLHISREISGTLDLDEVLNQLIDALKSAIPYDAAGIFVLNENSLAPRGRIGSHMIEGMATRGFPERPQEDDPMLKSGKGIIGYVIRTGKKVIARDVRRHPNYIEGREGTLSEIAVPIIVNGQVIGALNLESDRVNAFSEADAELLQFISNSAAIAIEKAMLHQHLLESKRIESQLKIARQVQAGLLPAQPPSLAGYDISAINLPNSEIGGDYFDYIPLPHGKLGIAIADVSGKGVPAALIMATFRAALRTRVRLDSSISRVMQSVNTFLLESVGSSDFVTAVFGALDPRSGRFAYSNCGHNPPLILRGGGSTVELQEGGLVLGVDGDARYNASTVTLDPGDVLVLYTDGVVEVPDPGGKEFGLKGLERTIRGAWNLSATDMIQSVVRSTESLIGSAGYDDDFTLMVVKRMEK